MATVTADGSLFFVEISQLLGVYHHTSNVVSFAPMEYSVNASGCLRVFVYA